MKSECAGTNQVRSDKDELFEKMFPVSRRTSFWVISLALSVGIACLLYFTIGPAFFKGLELFENMSAGAYHFFCNIAPFAVIVGGIVGAVIYGDNYARYTKNGLATYGLSVGSAILGCVVGGSLVYFFLMMFSLLGCMWSMVIIGGIIILAIVD